MQSLPNQPDSQQDKEIKKVILHVFFFNGNCISLNTIAAFGYIITGAFPKTPTNWDS